MKLQHKGFGEYRGEEGGIVLNLGHVIMNDKVVVRGTISIDDKEVVFDTSMVEST